jgi:DNA-directed RNA polymerase specialized sigma subunit
MQNQDLVLGNLKYAQTLATAYARRVGIDPEEALSAAYLGLCEAANKYDGSQNLAKLIPSLIMRHMRDYVRDYIHHGMRRDSLKSKELQGDSFMKNIDYIEEYSNEQLTPEQEIEIKELISLLIETIDKIPDYWQRNAINVVIGRREKQREDKHGFNSRVYLAKKRIKKTFKRMGLISRDE